MTDPQSEAEKIRNKRLAKLGSFQPPASTASPSATTAAPTAPPAPGSLLSSSPPSNQPGSHTQKLQSTPAQAREVQPKVAAAPNPTVPSHLSSQVSSASPSISRSQPSPASESIEQWTDRTLASIFNISLQPGRKTDGNGDRCTYLDGLRSELTDSGAPLLLTPELLDGAMIEVASQVADRKPLRYLLGCWKRVMKTWRNVSSLGPSHPKVGIIREARRICMSYCIFAITMPDMFGLEQTDQSPLVPHLLRDPESESGICHDFLAEAISRFSDDDSIKEGFVMAVEQMSTSLAKMTMNDAYTPYVQALRMLVHYPPMTRAITDSPRFLPADIEPQAIESQSLLGPWFALSPLHSSVAQTYFGGAQAHGEAYVQANQTVVRSTLRTHQDQLFNITDSIVKSAKEPRERILDWFALTVNKNHKRRGSYFDRRIVSSDGFMINITSILDRLCEPFMDTTFSKLDRIDVAYLRRSPRVDIRDETKLNTDQKASDEFYAQTLAEPNNFISEVFFLTLAAHHYGTEAANHRVSKIQKDIAQIEKEVARYEAERSNLFGDPLRLSFFDAQMKRCKDMLESQRSRLKATQGVLLDESTQQTSMRLMRYVVAWLLRIVQPETRYPAGEMKLPLAEEQPLVFQTLPEYFLEDIIDSFKFCTSQMPWNIPQTQCEELVTVCVTFLRSSEYIKNPYLKAGLVSILFYGVWPFRNKSKGVLGDLLNSSKFCHKYLFHALMKFYIEVEQTGAHTQFYDKFNIRYEIFQVMRCIWSNPTHRHNLGIESKVNPQFFVRFVNLLLNDVTYVLGESFTAFRKIHTLQEQLQAGDRGLSDQEREDKQTDLESTQRMAKNSMQLTNETISMLKLFTEVLAEAFTTPEIVQRLADMLDYNIAYMVGPTQREIKVQNPDQYHFKPLVLLSDLMGVYTNLKHMRSFHMAVARDGRSYRPANFAHAANIMQSRSMKSPEDLRVWNELMETIAKVKAEEDQAEEDLGEIPDAYLDPIMATLMEDPVILPQSRMTVDMSTIRSHLLSDPVDPFNRMPLKIEDVIPDLEMKANIDRFKQEARARKLDVMQVDESVMDNAVDTNES